jgi:TolB protein
MKAFVRAAAFRLVAGLALTAGTGRLALAQDTTFRGITLIGNYDPTRDKISVAVLPVSGAFGDSLRAIVQRDLDFSDRFTILPVEGGDAGAARTGGAGSGLNYSIFKQLNAAAVIEMTSMPTGVHVALHDVAKGQVVNVGDFGLPSAGFSRDWRLAVHRASDEIARWMTGQRGIAATRIAYIRGSGKAAAIRIIDSDGAGEITVPTDENGISPAWHPSGTMLAYSTYGDVGSRIVLFDLATTNSRTLAKAPINVQYITPAFTTDGTSILYARSGENGSDIYAVGLSGNDTPRRLTVGRGAENASPTSSPDGRRIVYVGNGAGAPELYIMDADGTDARLFTEYDFSDKNYRSDPDWSPDGRLIAYQEKVGGGQFQIRTIRATGGTPKQLTSEGANEQPSWAPDSRHLVFTSTRSGVRQLWILDTETFRMRQLTTSAGSRLGAWSTRLTQ